MSALSVSNSTIKAMNAALAHIGVQEITSFLDESLPARVGNLLFEDVLENALSQYPWRFAQRRVEAVRIRDTAPTPWEGLYTKPHDLLTIRKVLIDGSTAAFDVFEGNVAVMVPRSSEEIVSVEGTVIVSPDKWPGYFRQPFILLLAAAICVPITQDERRAQSLLQMGGRDLARAASKDGQARTQRRLDTGLFIRQRRNGGRR